MAENIPEKQPLMPTKVRSKHDKYVYAGFGIVLIIGCVLIYLHQRDPGYLNDWSDDHEAMQKQAVEQKKPLLMLFKTSPPCDDTKKLQQKINQKASINEALKKHDYLTSIALVTAGLKDAVAVEYKIKKLPTILLFSPDGTEVKRIEGYIGDGDLVGVLAAGAKNKESAQ